MTELQLRLLWVVYMAALKARSNLVVLLKLSPRQQSQMTDDLAAVRTTLAAYDYRL